jgi:hypothetical protein
MQQYGISPGPNNPYAGGQGADSSWFQNIGKWLKDNSGWLTAAGLALPLGELLLGGNKVPSSASSAQQAGNVAGGNALANQGAPAQAFQTAAGLGVPTAASVLGTTAGAAAPVISTQTGLMSQEAAAAQPLINAQATGLLPPGVAGAIQSALGADRAAITSGYANKDLAGSSTEAQDVGAGAGNILAQIPSILSQLVQTGTGLATGSGQAANTALQGVNSILNAAQGLQQAIGTETTAANAVTGGSNAVTNAANVASQTDLNIANLQLELDQQMQNALSQLGRNLALANLAPSGKVNVNI